MPISAISDILSDINSVFGPVKNIVEGFDKIFDWDGEKGALQGLSNLSTDLDSEEGDEATSLSSLSTDLDDAGADNGEPVVEPQD